MSCILLDIEHANIYLIMQLGAFSDGNVHGCSIRSPKKYKPTKQAVCCTNNLDRIVWNGGRLDYCELTNILLSDVTSEFFAKRTEKKQY